MKKILFQTLVFALVFLTACEEQPIVVEQMTPDTNRKILIEEFTGANCAACPNGAKAIENYQEQFGENVIAVSIHTTKSGPLGTPLSGSAYDLRTQDGDDLADLFGGLSGIPAAVFNRTKFPDESKMAVLSPDSWADFVFGELEKDPEIELETALEYEESTRTLIIGVSATPLVTRDGDFRISVMITESHIIDKQNNNGVIEDDYESNHILREVLSSVEGDVLTGSFVTNSAITKSYIFQIPEEDGLWVAENCNVVTFVSEVDNDDGSIEVLQADEEHLGE